MSGQVYKVTELNPKLKMEIGQVLRSTGLENRYTASSELFATFGSGDSLEGIAGSNRFGADCLLQFVAVREDARNEGRGKALLGRVLGFYSGKCRQAYLLTSREMKPYFLKFGFISITLDDLPEEIRESEDLSKVSVEEFTVMRLAMPKCWPII